MASELTGPRSEQLTAIIAAYLEAIESGRTPNRSESLPQHPLFAAFLQPTRIIEEVVLNAALSTGRPPDVGGRERNTRRRQLARGTIP